MGLKWGTDRDVQWFKIMKWPNICNRFSECFILNSECGDAANREFLRNLQLEFLLICIRCIYYDYWNFEVLLRKREIWTRTTGNHIQGRRFSPYQPVMVEYDHSMDTNQEHFVKMRLSAFLPTLFLLRDVNGARNCFFYQFCAQTM